MLMDECLDELELIAKDCEGLGAAVQQLGPHLNAKRWAEVASRIRFMTTKIEQAHDAALDTAFRGM